MKISENSENNEKYKNFHFPEKNFKFLKSLLPLLENGSPDTLRERQGLPDVKHGLPKKFSWVDQ